MSLERNVRPGSRIQKVLGVMIFLGQWKSNEKFETVNDMIIFVV